MTPKQISALAFLGLLVVVFLQLLGVFRIFLFSILWAIILAIVVFPLYRSVLRLFRGRRNWASLTVTFLVIFLTVGPMVFFSGTLVREAVEFYGQVSRWLEGKSYESLVTSLSSTPFATLWGELQQKLAGLNIELLPVAVKFLEKLTQTIVGQMEAGAKNFLVFVFDYLVTIFALFFFLRDGEALARGVKEFFPLSPRHQETIIGRLEQTISAVVRGVGITGITQGVLAGLAFWVLGVPYPLFLALLTAFLAFVPIGGAVIVWLPSALYLFFSGHPAKGIILFLWGVLVVSMVDNLLKPLLIGEKTRLPTLFLFFAVLGGLTYYGFIGVFLGPVLLTLFLALIQIYRKEYAER